MKELITIDQYAEIIGLPAEELKGRCRKEYLTIAREVYWHYLHCSGLGYRRISKRDGRTPETILSGVRTVRNLIETDHPLIEHYRDFLNTYTRQEIITG